MKSLAIWTNFDVFFLIFFGNLDFREASRQSGMTFFDPKPVKIAFLLSIRKSQEFSEYVTGEIFGDIAILKLSLIILTFLKNKCLYIKHL